MWKVVTILSSTAVFMAIGLATAHLAISTLRDPETSSRGFVDLAMLWYALGPLIGAAIGFLASMAAIWLTGPPDQP